MSTYVIIYVRTLCKKNLFVEHTLLHNSMNLTRFSWAATYDVLGVYYTIWFDPHWSVWEEIWW